MWYILIVNNNTVCYLYDCSGERNGYNIPKVTSCAEKLEWLSKDTKEILAAKERGEIPEKVRRLLGDGYLCMYQNLFAGIIILPSDRNLQTL